MSGSSRSDAGPTTESEFAQQLDELFSDSYANGVDVEGGWDLSHDDGDLPDWGVEVYEVVKPGRPPDLT